MIFTRSLLSLLVLAVICTGIPIKEHRGRYHRIKPHNRALRQAKGYEILNSRTLHDGTRHETIKEYGDELPSLPVPKDYEMSSLEGNDGSVLVPVDEHGKIDQDYLKRIQPQVVFMTKEEIERLNGSLPHLPLPTPKSAASVTGAAKNAEETLDYDDVDVPNLPRTSDYLSSKETDPDVDKNQEYDENVPKTDSNSANPAIDELKKELMEEIEEDRRVQEEEAEEEKERDNEKLDKELREEWNKMKEDIDDEAEVVAAEEKVLIKKVIEEIDNDIIHKEVEKKIEEEHRHHKADPKIDDKVEVTWKIDDVKVDEKDNKENSDEDDDLFDFPSPTEIVKTLKTDEPDDRSSLTRKNGGVFRTVHSSRTLKKNISPTFNILSTFTFIMLITLWIV